MTLPRLHDDNEFCLFHGDHGQHIGSNFLEARYWVAEHPEYRGRRIWGDWGTGGPRDEFEATALFFPDADDAETIAETAPERNVSPTLNTVTEKVCADICASISSNRAA